MHRLFESDLVTCCSIFNQFSDKHLFSVNHIVYIYILCMNLLLGHLFNLRYYYTKTASTDVHTDNQNLKCIIYVM